MIDGLLELEQGIEDNVEKILEYSPQVLQSMLHLHAALDRHRCEILVGTLKAANRCQFNARVLSVLRTVGFLWL